jgi:hypothetical protein
MIRRSGRLPASDQRKKRMLQKVLKLIKWVSLPALLIGAIFSGLAESYKLLMDMVICLGAVILVQRALRLNEYFWALGFIAIAVVFSPLLLVVKIFLLMGLTCSASLLALLAAFRPQPVPSS